MGQIGQQPFDRFELTVGFAGCRRRHSAIASSSRTTNTSRAGFPALAVWDAGTAPGRLANFLRLVVSQGDQTASDRVDRDIGHFGLQTLQQSLMAQTFGFAASNSIAFWTTLAFADKGIGFSASNVWFLPEATGRWATGAHPFISHS
jgi:hypothetical protein